ncbi:MAG: hypothetical protein J2O44_01565 [Porphyrobacter sp.]|nr:hypothetical protein [Porphyrobacter sp.]
MKKLALYLATATLAACNQSQPDAGADQTAAAAEPAPQPTPQAAPGTYSATEPDGTKMTVVLDADHSYTFTTKGQQTEAGQWAIVGGKTCFTPSEGANAVARCYADGTPDKDGVFTATPDQGDPLTVKKIA